MENKKIKILDVFAGIGGFHLALQQSIGKENVECIGFSEIDKFAKKVYSHRFPGSLDLGSITEIDVDSLEDFDIMTGGIPCQPFSNAGLKLGEADPRGGPMWEAYINILRVKKPKYFIIENVKGLMSDNFSEFRNARIEEMKEIGYSINMKVLNTKDFGLPQNRERVFIVGMLEEKYNYDFAFPVGEELKFFLKDFLDEDVDEKFLLQNCFLLNEINETRNQLHQSYGWDRKINESCRRIYSSYGIAPTLPRGGGGNVESKVEHNGVCRKLTPKEYAKLQGFAEGWSTDIVSNSQAYRQMGNAISVPVVREIFNKLISEKKNFVSQ